MAIFPTVQFIRCNKNRLPEVPNFEYRELQKHLFIVNKCIPKDLWPRPQDDAPWERFHPDHTKRIQEALDWFKISKAPPQDSQDPDDDDSEIEEWMNLDSDHEPIVHKW